MIRHMNTQTKQRLSRASWIEAGYRALAARGPGALKAEPLARDLGTTKGSFYWHFKDVPDYHEALLAAWETQAMPPQDEAGLPVPRLRALAESLGQQDETECAVRGWANGHHGAAASVARLDGIRLNRITNLLQEIGIANPEMARIILAAAIGMRELGESDVAPGPDAMASLVDLVLALR